MTTAVREHSDTPESASSDRARIALATCVTLPEPDPDEAPLCAALTQAGFEPVRIAWDGPEDAALRRCDLCVLRSTWNYPLAHNAFLDWLARAEQQASVLNPPALVRWNIHKRYLADLTSAGVAVAPTVFVERGASVNVESIYREKNWRDVVVKPAISAASYCTRRFSRSEYDEATVFLAGVASERDAMVQQYLPSVEHDGERSLVWIDGEITHAVRKAPRFADDEECVEERSVDIAPDERALAERVIQIAIALQPAMAQALYARVDIMRDLSGAPVLSELELIEPSLYFPQSPAALERFVAAIAARLHETRR